MLKSSPRKSCSAKIKSTFLSFLLLEFTPTIVWKLPRRSTLRRHSRPSPSTSNGHCCAFQGTAYILPPRPHKVVDDHSRLLSVAEIRGPFLETYTNLCIARGSPDPWALCSECYKMGDYRVTTKDKSRLVSRAPKLATIE
jgi:hypothetical protein